MTFGKSALAITTVLAVAAAQAHAQSNEDLAKKLSNPIASLISVPFQLNYDHGYGPNDGEKATLNIQPVIPIKINEEWNLISRTIVPVVWQREIAGPSAKQFGLGDTVLSFFLSPSQPTENGIIWGAGPVFLLPTATDGTLGGGKWGVGPTAVALRQDGQWTYGVLGNHIWSFAGRDDRSDVSSTFLQPFLSYTTSDVWTFALNTEATYDWERADWSVPINFTVSKLLMVDKQPISLSGGLRYWATAPENGPEGLGFRVAMTFLFPK